MTFADVHRFAIFKFHKAKSARRKPLEMGAASLWFGCDSDNPRLAAWSRELGSVRGRLDNVVISELGHTDHNIAVPVRVHVRK
jgi:hypothetical protein